MAKKRPPGRKGRDTPPHARTLDRVLAFDRIDGYRPLDKLTGITHSTIRNLHQNRDVMEPFYAIAIELGLAKHRDLVKAGQTVDRIEFFPELLKGPLGKRLIACAKQNDPELWTDLIKAKLTV